MSKTIELPPLGRSRKFWSIHLTDEELEVAKSNIFFSSQLLEERDDQFLALLAECEQHLGEIERLKLHGSHVPFCNYWTNPVGSPGCICSPRSRREITDMESELSLLRATSAGAIRDAALAFIEAVESVESAVNSCIQISFIHGVPYTGPQYEEQKVALKVLLALPSKEGQ